MGLSTTLILPDYIGRLGNRLYIYIHTLAACIHWGFRCANLTLQPHAELFANLRNNPFCLFPKPRYGAPLHRFARAARLPVEWLALRKNSEGDFLSKKIRVINFHMHTNQSMDSDDFFEKCRPYRWVILWGWASRANSLLAKYQDKVAKFCALNRKLNPQLTRLLDQTRPKGGKRVCLHIRLGDKKSLPGQTMSMDFFTRQARRLWEAHKNQSLDFWICSDEPVDITRFPPNTHLSPNKSLNEDFQIMVESDYLIGGVSTLSRAAAYLGSSKIYTCQNTEDIPLDWDGWQTGPEVLAT